MGKHWYKHFTKEDTQMAAKEEGKEQVLSNNSRQEKAN